MPLRKKNKIKSNYTVIRIYLYYFISHLYYFIPRKNEYYAKKEVFVNWIPWKIVKGKIWDFFVLIVVYGPVMDVSQMNLNPLKNLVQLNRVNFSFSLALLF